MSDAVFSYLQRDRCLVRGSLSARSIACAREVLRSGTSRYHYLFGPWPIIASHGMGCRLTDIGAKAESAASAT